MKKNYSSTYVKNNFGVIVKEVENNTVVIVEKKGKPVLKIEKYRSSKKDINELFGTAKDFPEMDEVRSINNRSIDL